MLHCCVNHTYIFPSATLTDQMTQRTDHPINSLWNRSSHSYFLRHRTPSSMNTRMVKDRAPTRMYSKVCGSRGRPERANGTKSVSSNMLSQCVSEHNWMWKPESSPELIFPLVQLTGIVSSAQQLLLVKEHQRWRIWNHISDDKKGWTGWILMMLIRHKSNKWDFLLNYEKREGETQ